MKYVEYTCQICEYNTKNKTHYDRHCNSPKHSKKIVCYDALSTDLLNVLPKNSPKLPGNIKIVLNAINEDDIPITIDDNNIVNDLEYKCEYCNNNFTRLSNLTRHKKVCSENIIKTSEYEKNLLEKNLLSKLNEYELKLKYEQELHKKDVEKYEIYKKEAEYYKEIISMAGGMVQKTVSALTYIVNTYDTAPVIKQITFEDVQNTTNMDDEKIISKIFYHYNRNKLGQYIGDIIVENYKKKDPSEQSIWSTDTSRLTYLLKKILLDDNSKWMVDKKGVETIDFLIKPIIDRVREMAIEYQEANCFGDNVDPDRVILINDIFSRLMIDIDNKKIHNDILKYIAPHFYLKVNIEIDEE